jgi:hypothetical protein
MREIDWEVIFYSVWVLIVIMSNRNFSRESPIRIFVFMSIFTAINVIYKMRLSNVTNYVSRNYVHYSLHPSLSNFQKMNISSIHEFENTSAELLVESDVNPLWIPMMKADTKHCFIYSAYFDLRPYMKGKIEQFCKFFKIK